ncbi:MAG: hypothetical protein ABIN94_09545 [Ferruginibacter sp.]
MKTQSNSSTTQISAEKMQTLTTIVTETLAIGFSGAKHKIFTSADLWNIQRQGRSRTQRRYSF